MDPWKLASDDGWGSITQENMKLLRNKITPNWKEAKSVSPWLKTLPQAAIDSARVVPVNFPGKLLQPSGSAGKNWVFFAGDHVSFFYLFIF